MTLLLDVMLGQLATHLRMCGYDAAYALDRGVEDDDRLREIAATEGRRLITRDVALAAATDSAILVTSLDVGGQLRELRDHGLDVALPPEPARCGRCNAPVEPVPATDATPDYAPSPDSTPVWRCVTCGQHFWRGSHWDDVRSRLASL